MGFFNRQEAKWKAREAIRGAYPHPMLVSLVYLLLTAGLTTLITRFVADPFTLAYQYLIVGNYEWDTIVRHVFTPARTGLFAAVQIVLSLYGCIMGFGYKSYGLRLARGEQPGYRNLMDGFSSVGRVLAAGVLTYVLIWLWTMLGMIPYVVVLILAVVMESEGLLALAMLLLVLAVVCAVVAGLRYQLAYYFLLDNPEMGAMEAIRHSKQAMKGWKGALFMLDLSFLGWMLLAPFTLGILSLWLSPYMSAAEANFYDHVVHGSFGPRTDAPNPGQPGGYQGNYGSGPQNPGGSF